MSQELLLLLPLLISLAAGTLCFYLPKSRKIQSTLSLSTHLIILLFSIHLFSQLKNGNIIVSQMGNWPAPFGITFVADLLSGTMLLVTTLIALSTCLFASVDMDEQRITHGYFSWTHFLLVGVYGALLTGDLFNLYVWFEVMLISCFALMSLGGGKRQLYATTKYLTMNLVSTVLLLTGIGLIYGITGSLNMAHLAQAVYAIEHPEMLSTAYTFLIVALGIKSAMFPLFFWLPASYYAPPVAVSALFGGILTKIGVYALIRTYSLLFHEQSAWISSLLMWGAILTILIGMCGACTQVSIRRVISFLIITAIGYLILGLSLFSITALMGLLFYMVHDMLLKANLFILGGIAKNLSHHALLSYMGGLYNSSKMLTILWLITCCSLAGLPPFSGFWGKLLILEAALQEQQYFAVVIAVLGAFVFLYISGKLWCEVVWKNHPKNLSLTLPDAKTYATWIASSAILVLTLLWIGLIPNQLLSICKTIASQLMNPASYVYHVLGEPLKGEL